jgi:hypothetical protein
MDLASPDLNYLAAVAGGVAYFAFGALWYTLLFGKRWMALRGMAADDPGAPPAMMGLTAIAGIVSTLVVGAVYEWAGGTGPVDGLVVGLIIGAGVVAMESIKSVVYEQAQWALYAINTSYAVLGFALAGLVYALIA